MPYGYYLTRAGHTQGLAFRRTGALLQVEANKERQMCRAVPECAARAGHDTHLIGHVDDIRMRFTVLVDYPVMPFHPSEFRFRRIPSNVILRCELEV